MPTYEYACRKCGEHLEVVQAFTDDPLTKCPQCKGPLRKVFGRVGIAFKGDGFYKTDSRKASSASSRSDRSEKAESGSKVTAGNGSGGDAPASKPAESSSGAKSDSSGGATTPSTTTKTSTPASSA